MSKTCCVTGHRDLPAGKLPEITAALSAEIDRAIAEGFDSFFSGFAEGVDLLFAQLVVQKAASIPAFASWPPSPSGNASSASHPSPKPPLCLTPAPRSTSSASTYHDGVYRDRNRFMVDRSQLVIAVYDGRGRRRHRPHAGLRPQDGPQRARAVLQITQNPRLSHGKGGGKFFAFFLAALQPIGRERLRPLLSPAPRST